MVITIGLFVIGIGALLLLGFLLGIALEEVALGIGFIALIPLIIGIFQVGKFLAMQAGWV